MSSWEFRRHTGFSGDGNGRRQCEDAEYVFCAALDLVVYEPPLGHPPALLQGFGAAQCSGEAKNNCEDALEVYVD